MKTRILVLLLIGISCCSVNSQSSVRDKQALATIVGDLNSPPSPEFTPAEIAVPPVGQIQKLHLRTVNQLRTILAATLSKVPAGDDGQGSPWFLKAQQYQAGLETLPVDSASVLILDADAVVTELKTRPWQEADQFIGNRTAAYAFERYEASGDGLAVLKTKFASKKATIMAKWTELAAWVATQRPPN